MLQVITHKYHNHSDNTQNFRLKKLQEINTNSRNYKKLIQKRDGNGTITPELVHNFGVNITPSSFDLDDHS